MDALDGLGGEGCEDWHQWTSFSGVQWTVYVLLAVSSHVGSDGLQFARKKKTERTTTTFTTGLAGVCLRVLGQVVCAVRCWIRHQ